MLRNLLTLVTAVALTAGAMAQSQVPVHKAVSPQFAGVYDMATGELRQGNTLGPVSIYNNNTLTNYYSVPGLDQEWIDEGQFCDRVSGAITTWEQINGFNFTYCSTEADPTQNSGTITFTIYDDFTICTGPSNGGNFANGGFVCAYDVVGLPLGDPNGVIQCWIVTVDLMKGFECPSTLDHQTCHAGDLSTDEANGKLFGWGIIPRNNNTGPWLATGGKGADNAFVWFDAFGIFQGCFWFGGTPFASFAFQAFGNDAGIVNYFPCNPGACDTLQLNVTGDTTPGNVNLCIEICNPVQGENYSLLAAGGRADNAALCGTLMIPQAFIPPTPIQFPATNKIVYNGALPGLVYLQAVCHVGPLTPGNVTQFSNGVCIRP